MSSLLRILEILRRRGPGYGLYLLEGYLWPRWQFRLLAGQSPRRRQFLGLLFRAALGGIGGLLLGAWVGWIGALAAGALLAATAVGLPILRARLRRQRWLSEARRALPSAQNRELPEPLPGWQDWPVETAVRSAVEAARKELTGASTGSLPVLVLGRIDADGRLLSPFGDFPDFDGVGQEEFLTRQRYDLDLVLQGERLAVRKDYRGDRGAFGREWLALSRLAAAPPAEKANVPLVLAVDEAACRLTRSFLPGDTVNDRLVARGARIRLAQTADDAQLAGLDEAARLEAVLARGTERLRECLHDGFLGQLERQIQAIHRQGVTGLSLTFGNVMICPDAEVPGGEAPWFFDFDNAKLHAGPEGFAFDQDRDRDRRLLQRLYDLDLVTEASARHTLATAFPSSYSPVDLGRGLATRGFWSVDSGTGRWDYLNGPALAGLVRGKRILDLGSHNCVLPLLMLRAGARQVVAVEQSPEVAESARRLQALFEWRDLATYDLDLKNTDMRAVLSEDWGSFDIVSSFCSLYYLEEDEMAAVVRRAAELAPIMVLQAKSDTRRRAADNKAEKSAPELLQRLLEEHGFPEVQTFAPAGFSRPLLIGRAADTDGRREP